LIGITIIGLLVGMLAVAGAGVIGTTREFAVTSEITQMSQAIESFKTEYGFYPPSFEQFKRAVDTGASAPYGVVHAEAQQLLPFLNKIAPNHQEASTLSPVPDRAMDGYTRLDDWWEFVGCNLDQTSSLQFWLSGLCQNKQFPLTGGLPVASFNSDLYMPVAYNVEVYIDGSDIEGDLDRKVFYDFDTDRMIPVSIFDGPNELRPVVQYVMEHGKTNGDLFYLYRDSGSYVPAVFNNAGARIALDRFDEDHPSLAYHFWDGTSPVVKDDFPNPNTFQLISFGLDGDAGILNPNTGVIWDFALEDGTPDPQLRGDLNSQLPNADDNLCNFAQGRLDKYITEQQ
jgi:hypothetical protein